MGADRVPVSYIGMETVLLGVEPVAAAGAVTFHVPGAVIDVDPSRPDVVPSALVGELGLAGPFLEGIYGRRPVAAMLGAVMAHGGKAPWCPVESGPVMRQLRRLAELRWCQRTSPVGLDPYLLEVEELTLLGPVAHLIEDSEGWEQRLLSLLGVLAERPEAVARAMSLPGVEGLLCEAAEVLTRYADVAEDLSVHTMATPVGQPAPAVRVDWSSWLRPVMALAAGGAGLSGTSTVGWADVPLGATSRHEDNVAWHIHIDDPVEVEVRVAAAPKTSWLLGPARPAAALKFDVITDTRPVPILTGDLVRQSDGSWRGQARSGRAQSEALRRLASSGGDIRVRVRAVGPRAEEQPPAARAQRWSVRSVAALRLYVASQRRDYLDAGRSALSEALEAWRAADCPAEAAWVEELLAQAKDPDFPAIWPVYPTVAEYAVEATQP